MNHEPKSLSTPSDAEPKATPSTVPIWIFALTLVLIYLGSVYFDRCSGWFSPNVYSPFASVAELDAYQPKSGAAAMMSRGKQVYEQICGICHGVDGMGKPGQAPPLSGSDFVVASGHDRLTRIPLMGVSGSISVKGQTWNVGMAAMGAALSDSDLAAVLSYIRGSWGNKAEPVSADDVAKVRAAVGKNPKPMPGDMLMKMPE